jgi:hypothetical protein
VRVKSETRNINLLSCCISPSPSPPPAWGGGIDFEIGSNHQSPVYRILCPVFGNLFLCQITNSQQFILGHQQVAPFFPVIFENSCFNDRIHRTGFFTESAEDTLGQINIITGGAPCSFITLFGFNGDGYGRTHCFT